MASSIMECRNKTIKALKRNVRTGCGDSEEVYEEEEEDESLNGEVQGKGNVASLWCLTSHTILEAHTALHTPILMTGETCNCRVKNKNDAFVDDMDGYAEADERG